MSVSPDAVDGHDAFLAKQLLGALAASASPQFVGTHQVAVGRRRFADLVQYIDEQLELDCELPIDVGDGVTSKRAADFSESEPYALPPIWM